LEDKLEALIAIGEGKVAVDMIRKVVDTARRRPPETPLELLQILKLYATTLEATDALAEADVVWAEALEGISAALLDTLDAADAFLHYGLLLTKMHNYDGAVARLKEAIHRADALTGVEELDRQILLARAWRGRAQALEALGEFEQASNALDVLMNIKRQIRFLVFATSRGS
jgi:tetratricopeptide (TPR) repeat protein